MEQEEMIHKIHELETELKIMNQKYITVVNQLNNLQQEKSKINPRGAGRKPLLNEDQANNIRNLYKNGLTMKQLSTMYDCSVGLIHKLINELT